MAGNKFTVEHLELTDITSLLADSFKDEEWKPNKVEETIFFMTRKNNGSYFMNHVQMQKTIM